MPDVEDRILPALLGAADVLSCLAAVVFLWKRHRAARAEAGQGMRALSVATVSASSGRLSGR